jgi:hypothetical protein
MVETNAREYLGEGMLRMHQDAVTAFGLLENSNSSSNNNTGDGSNTAGTAAAADAWNPSGTALPTDGGSLLQEGGDSPRPLHDRAHSVIDTSAAGMPPLNMALPGAAAEAAMQQQLAHEEVSLFLVLHATIIQRVHIVLASEVTAAVGLAVASILSCDSHVHAIHTYARMTTASM